ncbi:serine hydrolase [Fibrella aquatilis]|uniref:Serine hydrolase n=1 Tax=Fibrella aquatilis TaxID=2817059 RepID=A0A939K075_9BACT|nr:serine hydrolase [Fibrella aquatilis]MBO0932183.1 serine hydrolase [Fibrella aquatilis]
MNHKTSIIWPLLCAGLLNSTLAIAQPTPDPATNLGKTDKFLADLIRSRPELFGKVLANPSAYDVQVVYTQINRDAQNRPSFKTYRYQVDKDRYFYPASTVKLPAVLLALEKLNALGVPRDATMITDSAYAKQTRVRRDTTAKTGLPSVAQYARKILITSDNDAFNRLYELVGQCPFNDGLKAKGYENTRIVHRLSVPLNADQNAHTNPVFLLPDRQNGPTLEQITGPIKVNFAADTAGLNIRVKSVPAQVCDHTPQAPGPILRGTGYMVGRNYYVGDSLVKKPFDFTAKNAFPLEDQQAILRALLFPESVAPKQRFNLTPDDYRFVYQYMSQLPRETRWPNYKADTSLYDSYCKFLLFGDQKTPIPSAIRIFNKVGDAYGYLLDNAYVVDFDKGIEFMLTAMISCNSDGIFNDDQYDYDSVGYPFMGNLGRLIYDYEATRKKPRQPDLSRFRVTYDR